MITDYESDKRKPGGPRKKWNNAAALRTGLKERILARSMS
jgi:hypothetical protein